MTSECGVDATSRHEELSYSLGVFAIHGGDDGPAVSLLSEAVDEDDQGSHKYGFDVKVDILSRTD